MLPILLAISIGALAVALGLTFVDIDRTRPPRDEADDR